jgi:hypothetical protein
VLAKLVSASQLENIGFVQENCCSHLRYHLEGLELADALKKKSLGVTVVEYLDQVRGIVSLYASFLFLAFFAFSH